MNRRPPQRHPNGHKSEKNSFGISPQNSQTIRQSIDDSLYTVRFNAQDMRAVFTAAKAGKKPASAKKKRRVLRPDLIFAFSFMLLIALPASFYAIRARENMTTITSPGQTATDPYQSAPSNADIIVAPENTTQAAAKPADSSSDSIIDENAAIHIARECFEAQCDTSIFTFEEYLVSTKVDADSHQYTITLDSIYRNGCRFTVILSSETGAIIQYSSPKLATVPTYTDNSSPEVRAWFEKHGEFLFTWPQDVQAEFSRRYQGGTLRAAREEELTAEEAIACVSASIESQSHGVFTAFFPVLYSERASSTGRAFYLVYCYPAADEQSIRDSSPMTISFDAVTGDIISVEGNPQENESIASSK